MSGGARCEHRRAELLCLFDEWCPDCGATRSRRVFDTGGRDTGPWSRWRIALHARLWAHRAQSERREQAGRVREGRMPQTAP